MKWSNPKTLQFDQQKPRSSKPGTGRTGTARVFPKHWEVRKVAKMGERSQLNDFFCKTHTHTDHCLIADDAISLVSTNQYHSNISPVLVNYFSSQPSSKMILLFFLETYFRQPPPAQNHNQHVWSGNFFWCRSVNFFSLILLSLADPPVLIFFGGILCIVYQQLFWTSSFRELACEMMKHTHLPLKIHISWWFAQILRLKLVCPNPSRPFGVRTRTMDSKMGSSHKPVTLEIFCVVWVSVNLERCVELISPPEIIHATLFPLAYPWWLKMVGELYIFRCEHLWTSQTWSTCRNFFHAT